MQINVQYINISNISTLRNQINTLVNNLSRDTLHTLRRSALRCWAGRNVSCAPWWHNRSATMQQIMHDDADAYTVASYWFAQWYTHSVWFEVWLTFGRSNSVQSSRTHQPCFIIYLFKLIACNLNIFYIGIVHVRIALSLSFVADANDFIIR